MLSLYDEKKLLQTVVAVACLVPLSAGAGGIILGAGLLGGSGVDLDSHMRYLSGLLLGIGLSFVSTLPQIERRGSRFRLLTFIVVIGGLSRLGGLFLAGRPSLDMQGALIMELVVTPLLCLWQRRLARKFRA